MYIDAEEYLNEIRRVHNIIKSKRKALNDLDYMIETSGISYDKEIVASSPRQDGLERQAIAHLEKCAEIKLEITEKLEWLHRRIDEALGYINMIESGKQRDILIAFYIEGKEWSDILRMREEEGIYDPTGAFKLKDRAVESLNEIFRNNM